MEKNSLLKWVVAFTMTCSCFMSLAQSPGNYLLVGQVTDEAGEPLPGANVYMRGDIGNGTSTDANGYYSLELPGGKDIIVEASFLGMKTTSIEYIGQAEQDFVLRPDDNMMMEAVVTGRQNINDVDIRAKAGVINVVDVKRMQDKPMIDMSLSLQGAAPGLLDIRRSSGTCDSPSYPAFRPGHAASHWLFRTIPDFVQNRFRRQ